MKDNILVVGPAWVGDMVMAQALFKVIKDQNPEATLDVLAPEWSRPLTDRMPEVRSSISLPIPHRVLGLKQRYHVAQQLRENNYQRCYILPNSFKSALVPFLARIPERIGWMRECRYPLLTTVRFLNKKRYPLMVQRFIALASEKHATGFDARWRPALAIDSHNVQAALLAHGITLDAPVMVLCPGAEFGVSKRWPPEYYAALAAHYLQKGWQIWILGSPKDSEVAEIIQAKTQQRCRDLTGRTTLAEAIDLMSQATRVVTNDSGLMHIASALARPLVAIYGSTDPGFTPPLHDKRSLVRKGLPCSPCFARACPLQHHHCMRQLTVDNVITAVDELAI